ncbi:hypothetical protein BKA93DRAFT_817021 [Sparassis latifolia]
MLSAVVPPFLLFSAFTLLLLVSLSLPIMTSIYLFTVSIDASSSLLGSSTAGFARLGCSKAKLGCDFDGTPFSTLRVSGLENSISRTLSAVLVLHPIACGFAFLASPGGNPGLTSLVTPYSRGGAPCCTADHRVIFLVDVIFVTIVRNRLDRDSQDVSLTWAWMTLGATIALRAALLGTCVGIESTSRH